MCTMIKPVASVCGGNMWVLCIINIKTLCNQLVLKFVYIDCYTKDIQHQISFFAYPFSCSSLRCLAVVLLLLRVLFVVIYTFQPLFQMV